MEIGEVLQVMHQNLDQLLNRANVVACGVGYKVTDEGPTDEPAVVVSVTRKVPIAQLSENDLVPKTISGVKTDVIETGVIRAFQDHRSRWRPTIPPGVSIGHIGVTAGTFGCLVRKGKENLILSNNHVLADVNAGQVGDAILQPAKYDGGTADDKVATLAEYIPIDFGDKEPVCTLLKTVEAVLNLSARAVGSSHRLSSYQVTAGTNRVDAALARPVEPGQFSAEILEIGIPKGVRAATLGTPVQKSGRTTGLTHGQIIQVAVTTQVGYGGRMATFTDQLMAGAMSAPGDSGSAILDEERYVVGLLFAGSETVTIINPIQAVIDALGIEIVNW
jgi:hypothetical protein